MAVLDIKIERVSDVKRTDHGIWSGEAEAFCPECKSLQTVWFTEGSLITTRKYSQEGNRIYHDCGSGQPCRLYRI